MDGEVSRRKPAPGKAEDEPKYGTGGMRPGSGRVPRRTPIRPHEKRRKGRMLTITFPTRTWVLMIRKQAKALGMGTSEFAMHVFAQALEAIERGEWDPEAGVGWSPQESEEGDLWT